MLPLPRRPPPAAATAAPLATGLRRPVLPPLPADATPGTRVKDAGLAGRGSRKRASSSASRGEAWPLEEEEEDAGGTPPPPPAAAVADGDRGGRAESPAIIKLPPAVAASMEVGEPPLEERISAAYLRALAAADMREAGSEGSIDNDDDDEARREEDTAAGPPPPINEPLLRGIGLKALDDSPNKRVPDTPSPPASAATDAASPA